MKRNVIIACSAQKKEQLGIRPIWELGVELSEWKSIIESENGHLSPRELYNGMHFVNQKSNIQENSDHLWIASAGLGLLDGSTESKDRVNHYDAAFSRKFGTSIESWSELPFGGLDRLFPIHGQIIIALPLQYQKAIISDPNFLQISNRIIALGPGPLQEQQDVEKTPYHPRMIEIYGGQKLALFSHLLKSFYEDPINFSGLSRIKKNAEKLPPPPDRKKIHSEEELREILLSLPDYVSSGTKAVRYIRDQLKRSCSQERILSGWREL